MCRIVIPLMSVFHLLLLCYLLQCVQTVRLEYVVRYVVRMEYWSSPQAAHACGVGETTAKRIVRRAYERGDPHVIKRARIWLAPDWWWRAQIPGPRPRGRPRRDEAPPSPQE